MADSESGESERWAGYVGIYVGCSLATSSSFELQLCGKVAAGKLVTVQYTKPKDERTCTVSRISLNCGIFCHAAFLLFDVP